MVAAVGPAPPSKNVLPSAPLTVETRLLAIVSSVFR